MLGFSPSVCAGKGGAGFSEREQLCGAPVPPSSSLHSQFTGMCLVHRVVLGFKSKINYGLCSPCPAIALCHAQEGSRGVPPSQTHYGGPQLQQLSPGITPLW